MIRIGKLIVLALLLSASPVIASVIPEYATNTYTKKNPSRSEKKCIDEGYSITYENCPKLTAPTEQCPHHQDYYKSCSQEQWCINNNFPYKLEGCKLPAYPSKKCDNQLEMYRSCQLNIAKACESLNFTLKTKCKITNERCPYSTDYGKCCTPCEGFSHDIKNIPAGYVSDGITCTNCENITKTNIIENPCEGFLVCPYGPETAQTPSCQKGSNFLYETCKTAEIHCKETGFDKTSCAPTEDSQMCSEFDGLMKCTLNCAKLAAELFPEADIINENITDPILDVTKTALKSAFGQISETCVSNYRPTITLNLNKENMELYSNILNREISNVTLVLNYVEPLELAANGKFHNVRLKITGTPGACALQGLNINVSGTLNVSGADNICTNINIEDNGKFITTGNVTGNIDLGKNATLGIKGNLFGYLKANSYSEIIIKGILKYKDSSNNSLDHESISFGCGAKAKISGGIIAETANVVLKQRALIDTAYIKMVSTSDNPDLINTLSQIHIHRNAKVYSVYDSTEFLLVENNDSINCDDKYTIHLGSSIDENQKAKSLEPSDLLEDKWQCRQLDSKQLKCD